MQKKVFLMITLLLSALLCAAVTPEETTGPDIPVAPEKPQNNVALNEILAVPPANPRGPRDILVDYERDMDNITGRLSAELASISQAFAKGHLTRERAEYLSHERYQIAMMQFQLLSAWHAILEQNLDEADAKADNASSGGTGASLVVPLPFSSLQLNPSLAQYLGLSPEQVSAIQDLMSSARRYLAPLIDEMATTRQKLATATNSVHPDQEQVHGLAVAQARLLTRLIAANSELQIKIGRVLNPQQRRKLQQIQQPSELGLLEAE